MNPLTILGGLIVVAAVICGVAYVIDNVSLKTKRKGKKDQ
jgi:hypothetical protein